MFRKALQVKTILVFLVSLACSFQTLHAQINQYYVEKSSGEYFEKAPELNTGKPLEQFVSTITTSAYITISSTDVTKTPDDKKRESPQSNDIFKIGVDLIGSQASSVSDDSINVGVMPSISVSIESYKPVSAFADIGLGLTYQFPRFTEHSRDSFGFIPVYLSLKVHSKIKQYSCYFITQYGYGILLAGSTIWEYDTRYSYIRGGGGYYAAGIGFVTSKNAQIEMLYSLNKGRMRFWPHEAPVDFTVGFEYSKTTLAYCFRF